ncbi:vinorine synthase-like [Melia azedarach]|uniref:Vinorine synthase-like n=1 Tax=Melia azedarach TaxID=155640 RepID=A0ACC1YIZ6_MELAZ|nr:vinorine synthase-like [Melia azedarach]
MEKITTMQPQILSKKLIKPANPTPLNLSRLKISSTDQFHPPLYVSYIFCDPAGNQDDGVHNSEYIEQNLSIDCNDDGIQFSEAKIDCNLTPFLVNDADSKQLIRFVQPQKESASAPLVSDQCNVFECGGLIIGVNISHRIVVATVFSKFLDGWAKACRVGIHEVNRLEFNLFSLLPGREKFPEKEYLLPFKTGLKISSKTFVFNSLSISNMRKFTPEKKKSYYNLEFEDFSFLLSNAITNVVKEGRKLQNWGDLFSTVKNAWIEANREFDREETDAYSFTSTCTMPFYLDFGWGKPARIFHVQSEVEMIMLADSRDGDGIEARIS